MSSIRLIERVFCKATQGFRDLAALHQAAWENNQPSTPLSPETKPETYLPSTPVSTDRLQLGKQQVDHLRHLQQQQLCAWLKPRP